MSPRAAWRLESLGFTQVYDYTDGKLDWMAAGLPTEGINATRPRAGNVARRDVPTCGPTERLGEVRQRVSAAGWNVCVVVNDERVVFGMLRFDKLVDESDHPVEAVMAAGPSTVRPYVSIEEMAQFMIEHDLATSPVTTSDGRLVGVLMVEDVARVAHEQHAHHPPDQGAP